MGSTTDRLVNVYTTSSSRQPYYAIGNLLEHANIQSAVELKFIGYQKLDQIQTTQCVEILTTGILAATQCHLPPHCGQVEYFKSTSTWTTETGVCIGMGSSPIVVTRGSTVYSKNLYKIYEPQLAPVTFESNRKNIRHKRKHVVNHHIRKYGPRDFSYRGLSPDDVVMFVLNLENSDKYYLYAASIYSSFALYFPNMTIIKPWIQVVDNRLCIPTIPQSHLSVVLGPMTYDEAIYNSIFTPVWLPGMTKTTLRFVTDYDSYMNGSGYVVANDDQFELRCDPAKATLTLLPVSLTTVLNTIGQAVLVVIVTIMSSLLDAIWYLVRLLNYAINIYLCTLFIIINVYKFRMSLFDSALTSLATTVVVQYLHGHYNHGYS